MDNIIESEERVIGNWRIVKEKHADYDVDLSWLGEVNDKWDNDAIDRFKSPRAHVENQRREYRYFHPCNTYQMHKKGLSKMGYSKGNADFLARSYVMQDFQMFENYGHDWQAVGFVVKVYYRGIEVGFDSLWGIEEFWSGEFRKNEHHQDYWKQITAEAFHNARQNIADICSIDLCAQCA